MARMASNAKRWNDDLRAAAKARGLRFVSGEAYALDDVYITTLAASAMVPRDAPSTVRVHWNVAVKPLVVDDVLWAAFLPDVEMGAQMRLNRRVNGAFRITPLRIGEGTLDADIDAEPDWTPVFDDFDRARAAFVDANPTVADYASRLEPAGDGVALERRITALIGAGDDATAAAVAAEALARGAHGSMVSTVDVLKYLHAYARGAEAYAALTASLVPTHEYEILSAAAADHAGTLLREHHVGVGWRLAKLDGANPWAIVLSELPAQGEPDDHASLRYLQAAGAADRMTVELCLPGGAEHGCVSVRSVVGRTPAAAAPLDQEIEVPRFTMTVAAHEVLTAPEAATLFDTFFKTGALAPGYVLRAVEGFRADGASVDLSSLG